MKKPVSFRVVTGLLAITLSLTSCAGLFDQKKPKTTHHKVSKTQMDVSADAYATHLAVGRLLLAANPDDADVASADAQYIKSYHASKKRKQETLTLVVLEYKTKDGSKQKIAAPVTKKPAYTSLRTVLDKMQSTSATLQNIQLVSATVAPDKNFFLPEDADSLPALLDSQQQQLMAHSHSLSLVDNIRIQLDLLAFFTSSRYQDAAYLTLDNTKRSIANATQDKTLDNETVTAFSNRLDALENSLKKDLPYKL